MTPDPKHSPGHSGNGGRFADDEVPDNHPSQAFQAGLKLLAEAKEYGSYFLSAKIDGYKASARNIGIYIVLGLAGGVIGATALVMTIVLLMSGLAGGMARLAESAIGPTWGWLGATVFSLLILGVVAGAVVFGMRWLTKSSRSTTVAKYEQRKRQQRSDFGHDVHERAGR